MGARADGSRDLAVGRLAGYQDGAKLTLNETRCDAESNLVAVGSNFEMIRPRRFRLGGRVMSEERIADGFDIPLIYFEAVGNMFVRSGNFHITLMKIAEIDGCRTLIPQTELVCPIGNVPGHIKEVLKATSKWLTSPPAQEVFEADRVGRH